MKTMRSKSLDFSQSPAVKVNSNKTSEFASFYKSAAELHVKSKPVDKIVKENNSNVQASTPKVIQGRKKNKFNESANISSINLDGLNLDAGIANAPALPPKSTSTPLSRGKTKVKSPRVKSIMKSSSISEADNVAEANIESPNIKPKKRNKSVSFMLEEQEGLVIKKTKPTDASKVKNNSGIVDVGKPEKKKKIKPKKSEKENIRITNVPVESDSPRTDEPVASGSGTKTNVENRKKKFKKVKKQKQTEDSSEITESESSKVEKKKNKKKKRRVKVAQAGDTTEGEPATKSRKIDVKPDIIAEDLENLSIGDNADTISNLIDKMTVAEKNKRKKMKSKLKHGKKAKTNISIDSSQAQVANPTGADEKEKIKWNKRKWNKDKKGDVNQDLTETMVIVENLPLDMLMTYKNLLKEHFVKYGLIKKIGIAEMYPTEEAKPVFTSTILFYSEGAASKALEEDNSLFEGHRIRIKKPLPPWETTLVVRSYAELTEQAISSVFASAGKIRHIRLMVKGRKTAASAFIEFDGPASVQRAIKLAEDCRIGGKKIYVSKFDQRKASQKTSTKSNAESENEGDSENSNE